MSFDTAEENLAFAEKFDFNFPLICDTTRTLGLAYGATEPGKSGGAKRVGVVIAPDGTVKEYAPSVSAAEYPNEILARL